MHNARKNKARNMNIAHHKGLDKKRPTNFGRRFRLFRGRMREKKCEIRNLHPQVDIFNPTCIFDLGSPLKYHIGYILCKTYELQRSKTSNTRHERNSSEYQLYFATARASMFISYKINNNVKHQYQRCIR